MSEILFCPICKTGLNHKAELRAGGIAKINCPNCGSYNLAHTFVDDNIANGRLEPIMLATLSYAIRRMQGNRAIPLIVEDLAMSILQTTALPTATEQIDNLVLYLGQTLTEPGEAIELKPIEMRAILGSITLNAAQWVIQEAIELGWVQAEVRKYVGNAEWGIHFTTLSISGWQRYTELQNATIGSRRAFMAMKFGIEEMDKVFKSCFKEAAKRAGYNLVKLDDEPRAGLIDDHLRLDIRTSRFLVADLSHANKGAYWEAGFAEGLGKPVIYTCKESVMRHEDKEVKPHFDTNHHLIITWNLDNLQEAADKLTTTIRATLPSEAKLTDD